MRITKSWKTTTGKKVTVTGILILNKTHYCDGDNVDIKCCEQYIDVSVEGIGSQGSWVQMLPQPITQHGLLLVAKVGKLGLTEEQVDIINSVKAEIEATPEWQAKLAILKKAEKKEKEYQRHYDRVKAIMSE